jgi:hypothetical protein
MDLCDASSNEQAQKHPDVQDALMELSWCSGIPSSDHQTQRIIAVEWILLQQTRSSLTISSLSDLSSAPREVSEVDASANLTMLTLAGEAKQLKSTVLTTLRPEWR